MTEVGESKMPLFFFFYLQIFKMYQLTSEFPSTFIEAASETDIPQREKYIKYSLKTMTFMFQQSIRDSV